MENAGLRFRVEISTAFVRRMAKVQAHSGRSVARSLHTAMGQAILYVQCLLILTTTWPGQKLKLTSSFSKRGERTAEGHMASE